MATQIIHGRGSLVIQRTFDARVALKLIEKERITCMFGAPAMLDMIVRDPLFETIDLSSVRYFTAGAAPAPVNLIEKFHHRGIKIRQGFGLTETSPAVCMLHDEYALLKPGSCGKEFFHLYLRIVDEHGKDVVQGEVGEIIVKGPNVMLGYWKDLESTRQALRDGWLYTGDLAKRDGDGFIYIVDRKKDLIISGGENIYPAEVEAVLLQHSHVAEAAVVGKPDEKWGEVPVAYVVLEPGAETKPQELVDFCRSRLGKYKIPKEFRFIQELPRIASGKVDKKVLRRRSS
jgi:fatty-acyl-CoA synthase